MPEIIILNKLNSFKRQNQAGCSSCPAQMQGLFFLLQTHFLPDQWWGTSLLHPKSSLQSQVESAVLGPIPKLAFLVQVTCKGYFFLEK